MPTNAGSPAHLSPNDQAIFELVTGPEVGTIADVVKRMEALDTLLQANDGLKWFNRMYLMVTQQVDLNPPGGAWKSPAWLTRLDVIFAGFYFSAVVDYLTGRPVAPAWTALFESRYRTGIDRIQFALAGMNAHINHDLALALVATDADQGVVPTKDGPEFADYQSINELLNGMMPSALTMLAADTLGVLAQDTGKAGRLLAFWNICSARCMAWDFADQLRSLPGAARAGAVSAQSAMTGVLGRAILVAA